MNRRVGIVRKGSELERAVTEIEECRGCLDKITRYYSLKLQMVLDVSLLITKFALIREESRGVHIREDFPEENPEWRSHIVVERDKQPEIHPAYGLDWT